MPLAETLWVADEEEPHPTEQRAARTSEAMRRLRRRLKHELGAGDTTTLALITVAPLSRYGEIRTPVSELSNQVIAYIDRLHGRRLTEETRWHLEKKVWPWMHSHKLLDRDETGARWFATQKLAAMLR